MLASAVIKPYLLVVILVEIQLTLTHASHRIDIIKAEHLQLNKQKVEFEIIQMLTNF